MSAIAYTRTNPNFVQTSIGNAFLSPLQNLGRIWFEVLEPFQEGNATEKAKQVGRKAILSLGVVFGYLFCLIPAMIGSHIKVHNPQIDTALFFMDAEIATKCHELGMTNPLQPANRIARQIGYYHNQIQQNNTGYKQYARSVFTSKSIHAFMNGETAPAIVVSLFLNHYSSANFLDNILSTFRKEPSLEEKISSLKKLIDYTLGIRRWSQPFEPFFPAEARFCSRIDLFISPAIGKIQIRTSN